VICEELSSAKHLPALHGKPAGDKTGFSHLPAAEAPSPQAAFPVKIILLPKMRT